MRRDIPGRASRSNRGESLTEVLVAIVVSGLAILMLATVIASAANTVHKSRDAMDDYFAASNEVAAASTVNAKGTVVLTEGADESDAVALSDDPVAVEYTVSDEIQNWPVIVYRLEEEEQAAS